ncbi:MAG: ArsR/SmtB family transcription factor [Ornithinimicrobium sp.]|uniref:ArsR/SmtB family transcription factor n=1 Tax=Ornithinimicrobium sp. TaxID=1977084 RepID=UPI003D9BA9C4
MEDVAVTESTQDVCCAGACGDLLPSAEADRVARICKALADPTRVRLVQYLAFSESGTVCACHLPDALGISQPTLSFHMRKLHDAGLVTRDKRGRWVHYSVRADTLRLARDFLTLPDQPGTHCC